MFLANKLNKGAGVPTPVDAQFNYVTMLLHGDGTNGAQNNTFLDSGPNTFTITRNGNTTQGSFSPYGSNWSNYLNNESANNSYLSVASNAAFAYGTADFTVECWVFMTATPTTIANGIIEQRPTGTDGNYLLIGVNTSDQLFVYVNTANRIGPSAGTVISKNSWNHIAYSRSSGTATLYLNGTSIGSWSDSTNYGNQPVGIGFQAAAAAYGLNYFAGYISNVRIVKGTAVYTSAFTPSTTPLTAITNTSLLTCQSNRFIDNSASPLTITVNGTPSVQRFNPFGTATAYDTSVIGGSGYFDGSGDLLTLADSSAWDYGSGDFTIEFWYYPVSNTTTDIEFIGQWTSGSTDESWSVGHHWTNGLTFFWSTDGSTDQTLSSATILTLNAWNHIAVSKSGTTVSLYLNGARLNTGTLTGSIYNSSRVLDVGGRSQSGANQIQGYLSDVRTVKGTAVYNPTSTTLTVPTAPLTAITNTALLMNFTNGAIFDNAMINDLETLGNAQISTSVKKYGTGSIAFDGTGDWMLSTASQSIGFRTGDFTVEFWINPTNWSATYAGVIAGITNNSLWIGKNASNFVLRAANNTDLITYGTMPTTGTWTHIAITRSGTTARMFYDGTQVASATTSNDFVDGAFYIGQDGGSNAFIGYLDDFRITKGFARYTTTFTPPTKALSDTGPI